ncbi:MAG: ATP-binding protein [Hyphomicrobiaceae bacterium]
MADSPSGPADTLPPGLSIGKNSAEADDEFLQSCFIRTPAYDDLTNFDSPRMIALGRTGAGKTAILNGIQNNFGKISEIDPISISMEYISNSTVLTYLNEVGADIDLLFQVIWKHVLCVEYIRLRYNVKDQKKWLVFLSRLEKMISKDERRAAALTYLQQYEGKFWIAIDENMKEVMQRITKKLEGAIGYNESKASSARDLTTEEKKEIGVRFRKIVTAEQLSQLSNLVGLLADDEDKNVKHFILIDRLDEQWVDDKIRFRMIRALIETLRGFRKIRKLKIVVALRTDVLERVLQETKDAGFQREKHDDYAVELKWTPVLLMHMVSERLQHMSNRKLRGVKLTFADLFPRKIGNQTLAGFIVDRTLHRPRDFLAYVNLCLQAAEGKKEISASIVREVEREYSIGRYGALKDEWATTYPCMPLAIEYFAKFPQPTTLEVLSKGPELQDLVQAILIEDQNRRDPFYSFAEAYLLSSENSEFNLVRRMVRVLYRIGAIGVRKSPEDKIRYAHTDTPTVEDSELVPESSVRFHQMFAPALLGTMAREAAA